MNTDELIKQVRRIIESSRQSSGVGILFEAMEFFRIYTRDKSTFFKQLSKVDQGCRDEYIIKYVISNLEAFIRYAENSFLGGISIEGKAQIDAVSDFKNRGFGKYFCV